MIRIAEAQNRSYRIVGCGYVQWYPKFASVVVKVDETWVSCPVCLSLYVSEVCNEVEGGLCWAYVYELCTTSQGG